MLVVGLQVCVSTYPHAAITGLSPSIAALISSSDRILTSNLERVVDTKLTPVLRGRVLQNIVHFYRLFS